MPDTRSSTKAARLLAAQIRALEEKRDHLIAQSNAVNESIEKVIQELRILKGETYVAVDVETEYETDDTLYMVSPSPSVDEEGQSIL